jgi:TPR repeat protein
VRHRLIFPLLAVWILTGASSCQTTVNSGNVHFQGSGYAAAAGIGVMLVGAGIYCLMNQEECFPDEELLAAQAAEDVQAQASFTAGLRRHRAGDPVGLEWICLAAHQGYANAQYYYGVQLLRQDEITGEEAVIWIRRAAAQGHREAEILSRRLPHMNGAVPSPAVAVPPSLKACAAA